MMKILHILPEFQEGGVERHVLWLSNELAATGHDVTVVSAGGKLENDLRGVRHICLPVHRKNPGTGFYSALRIAIYSKREKIDIIHAHSRVPAWIAWWASLMTSLPFVITGHGLYSDNLGLIPYRHADGVICVSDTVRKALCKSITKVSKTILNGLPPVIAPWTGAEDKDVCRLLFLGRLTRIKGLHLVIEALGSLTEESWVLDVAGDGPQRKELEDLAHDLQLQDRVFFHGFQDNPDEWMKKCSCFLFPSIEEGMGLTLMRAVQMGTPVIASDIPAVRELLKEKGNGMVTPDSNAWRESLSQLFKEKTAFRFPLFFQEKLHSLSEATKKTLAFYRMVQTNRK